MMMNAWLVNLPFAIYLVALVSYGTSYLLNRKLFSQVGKGFLGVGGIVQTVGLIWVWFTLGRPPMSNQYESILFFAWAIVLLYFFLEWKGVFAGLGFWVAALVLLALATTTFLDKTVRPLMPALQSNWLLYHVSVTMLGYGALALAAVGAGVYLVCYRNKETEEKARTLDAFLFRATTLGFLLLTGGIILGAVWANETWGSYWSWDPKETWSLLTWFWYAISLHLRQTRAWRGVRFASLLLVGFLFVLFTYFGVNYLLSGLHSYA